ncbi:Small nuclear RNA activating complex (SNAPc), subunit SNAP43 [Heracleum sosnowskyi]|uniref:Small nuclear RNA activating complex (SNAPc), subunit SNAP43 n=1 Tax=Heracleum sosnowskyi TaxID=360622 RepID=A0AAD8GRD2_9APIA|nr:Small nuclear RNA activating complex (SNAPc), subunit SNAP43 [Heracleum sosnowskyi]
MRQDLQLTLVVSCNLSTLIALVMWWLMHLCLPDLEGFIVFTVFTRLNRTSHYFRIYISLGELRRLRKLVVDSKKENVNVAPALVNRMLERNMFLFGAVDLKESSVTEKMKELRAKEDATIRIAQKKLFENSQIEHFIHMDLGIELDVYHLKKMSTDYERVKKLAVKESCNLGQQQDTIHSELDHSPNEGDDDNYQLEEDGIDDDFAMELEQDLIHNEGDSEDELVMEL